MSTAGERSRQAAREVSVRAKERHERMMVATAALNEWANLIRETRAALKAWDAVPWWRRALGFDHLEMRHAQDKVAETQGARRAAFAALEATRARVSGRSPAPASTPRNNG